MKTTILAQTLIASVLSLGAGAHAQSASAAQTSASAPADLSALSSAQSAQTPGSAVNPMTGKPLSEEQLARALAKSKLLTQLGQEQVKQAQNAADLVLANLRADTEKSRARAETLAQAALNSVPAKPAATARNKPTVTLIKPVATDPSAMSAPSAPGAAALAGSAYSEGAMPGLWSAVVNAQPAPTPSGTIRIGDETLDVAATATRPAQVQWVDSQTKQIARAGSPLQPISVSPATGVLGIPPIPGIMPTGTNSGAAGAMQ